MYLGCITKVWINLSKRLFSSKYQNAKFQTEIHSNLCMHACIAHVQRSLVQSENNVGQQKNQIHDLLALSIITMQHWLMNSKYILTCVFIHFIIIESENWLETFSKLREKSFMLILRISKEFKANWYRLLWGTTYIKTNGIKTNSFHPCFRRF